MVEVCSVLIRMVVAHLNRKEMQDSDQGRMGHATLGCRLPPVFTLVPMRLAVLEGKGEMERDIGRVSALPW